MDCELNNMKNESFMFSPFAIKDSNAHNVLEDARMSIRPSELSRLIYHLCARGWSELSIRTVSYQMFRPAVNKKTIVAFCAKGRCLLLACTAFADEKVYATGLLSADQEAFTKADISWKRS